ncbi:hypothetical protein LguiA_001401 [Lonicera macranthoides]
MLRRCEIYYTICIETFFHKNKKRSDYSFSTFSIFFYAQTLELFFYAASYTLPSKNKRMRRIGP